MLRGPVLRGYICCFRSSNPDLAEAIDTVAQLIRGVGEEDPGIFSYIKRTSIKFSNKNASAQQMVKELTELRLDSKNLETAQKVGDVDAQKQFITHVSLSKTKVIE